MRKTQDRIDIVVRALARDFGVTAEIDTHAPGDGWTRYSVSLNSWRAIANSMTRRECELYLQGAYDLLRLQQSEARKAPAAPAALEVTRHPHVVHGLCRVCGHYGDDCTGCQHGPGEDCMNCAVCGRCDETLDENDVCDNCRKVEDRDGRR